MTTFFFDRVLAWNATTDQPAESAVGAFYGYDDTGHGTKLWVSVSGGPVQQDVTSSNIGFIDPFTIDDTYSTNASHDCERIRWVSGTNPDQIVVSMTRIFAELDGRLSPGELDPQVDAFHYIHPASAGVWQTPPSLPNPPNARYYFFLSGNDATLPQPIASFPTLQDGYKWWPAPGVDPNA